VARYFRQFSKNLIIEWVPKADIQVQRLLRSREDIFDQYEQSSFEAAFGDYFTVEDRQPVGNDGRLLYRMSSKE
jgi:hypothetical protein